ncbi:MAG: hypothetical protein JWO55_231 [Candidatus Saccharibacteria bacterium]|jgi:hypothetical protein|nr:hypothetical protein [Candidatus Saccharibacteria bacterium]
MTRQLNGPYEASLVIPFNHYADRDDFQIDADTYETHGRKTEYIAVHSSTIIWSLSVKE